MHLSNLIINHDPNALFGQLLNGASSTHVTIKSDYLHHARSSAPPPNFARGQWGLQKEWEKGEGKGGGGGGSQLVSPSYITWSSRQTESALFVKEGSVYKYMDVSGRTKIPELDMVEPIHPVTPIGLENKNPVHHPFIENPIWPSCGWMNQDPRMSQSYKQSNFHLTLCK